MAVGRLCRFASAVCWDRHGNSATNGHADPALPCLGRDRGRHAQVRLRGEAFSGQPFGVGRVEVEIAEPLQPEILGADGLGIRAKDNRVLYPAVERRPLLGAAKELLSGAKRPAVRIIGEFLDRPGRTSIYFLFVGDGPLELSVAVPPHRRPDDHAAGRPRAIGGCWPPGGGSTTPSRGCWRRSPTIRPSWRTTSAPCSPGGSNIALPARGKPQSWHEKLARELGLAAGTESLRLAAGAGAFPRAQPAASEPADQPLPAPVATPAPEVPEPAADVQIEPLAQRVPAECLYVRFGGFNNFLWFQDTLARWGGDFQNLVATRGLDSGTRKRFETQLGVETTALARLLGDTLVADVAIVGTDLFLKEGGAYGLLFQARSSIAAGQRLQAAASGAAQDDQGRDRADGRDRRAEGLYLSSPDGSVRSYYAVDGDYHLITTSKALAKRFLETRSGKGSLGATQGIPLRPHGDAAGPQGHGLRLPVERVLPQPHLAGVSRGDGPPGRGPGRHRAGADGPAWPRRPKASRETRSSSSSTGGFLPPGFGPRADGSRAVIDHGEVRDSLRGERGAFTPIPDVEVARVSRAEAETFREFAEFYQSNWERLDPVLVGIQRQPRPDNRERVVLDAAHDAAFPESTSSWPRDSSASPTRGGWRPFPPTPSPSSWSSRDSGFSAGCN